MLHVLAHHTGYATALLQADSKRARNTRVSQTFWPMAIDDAQTIGRRTIRSQFAIDDVVRLDVLILQ